MNEECHTKCFANLYFARESLWCFKKPYQSKADCVAVFVTEICFRSEPTTSSDVPLWYQPLCAHRITFWLNRIYDMFAEYFIHTIASLTPYVCPKNYPLNLFGNVFPNPLSTWDIFSGFSYRISLKSYEKSHSKDIKENFSSLTFSYFSLSVNFEDERLEREARKQFFMPSFTLHFCVNNKIDI